MEQTPLLGPNSDLALALFMVSRYYIVHYLMGPARNLAFKFPTHEGLAYRRWLLPGLSLKCCLVECLFSVEKLHSTKLYCDSSFTTFRNQ